MFDLFARIGRLIQGFFSYFISSTENANPRALLELEVNGYNKAVADYNKNLAQQAGLIENLKMQIARDEKALVAAEGQAKACAAAGQMDRAGQFAMTAKTLTVNLAENRNQQATADTLFKDQTRQRDAFVKEARARIDRVKSKISRADMAEAQAKLATMASTQLFEANGGGLSKLEERLDDRISGAKGTVRVATDAMSTANWIATEGEQKALEQQALAELLGTANAPAAALAAPAPVATPDPVADALKAS